MSDARTNQRTTRRSRRSSSEGQLALADLIGDSRSISEVVATCLQVAQADANVLLLGETGTGKELLARAIHEHSGRPGSFVAINCGAVTESLVESELFGHEKGAFTGATASKPGLFREAHHGTLLLDEIGSLPLPAQHSLLRVLQEGKVRPVGSAQEVPVDVRVIAATSVSLSDAMERGVFRPDLFYRLDVIRVVVPPLRNRGEDIVTMFKSFSRRMAHRHGVAPTVLTPDFEEALLRYSWPGNVRQLKNLTERLVLTSPGERLTANHFERLITQSAGSAGLSSASDIAPVETEQGPDLSIPLKLYLERKEQDYLQAALARTGGHVRKAAKVAGLSRRTLSRKLKKYRLGSASGEGSCDEDEQQLWLVAPALDPYLLDANSPQHTVGRSNGCDLVVPLPGISRVHARLRCGSQGWVLEDAGSRNGTRCNGAPVSAPVLLAPGDRIELDSFQLRVVESAGPPRQHDGTSAHLVKGQLELIPLAGVLARVARRGATARIDVAAPEGTGQIQLLDGSLAWATFEGEDGQRVSEEAVHCMRSLAAGQFVVSGSPDALDESRLLVPLRGRFLDERSETREFVVSSCDSDEER